MFLAPSTIHVDDALPPNLPGVARAPQGRRQQARWGRRVSGLTSRRDSSTLPLPEGVHAQRNGTKQQPTPFDGFTLLRLAGVSLPEEALTAAVAGRTFAGCEVADLPHFCRLFRLTMEDCTGFRLEHAAHLPALRSLALVSCELSRIGELPAPHLSELAELDLGYNALDSAAVSRLTSLPSLRKLSLESNGLRQLPAGLARSAIEDLNLSRNSLGGDDGDWAILSLCPNLRRLNLAHNMFSDIPRNLQLPQRALSRSSSRHSPEPPLPTPSEGGIAGEADNTFLCLQWISLAHNRLHQDASVAALLSHAQELRQVILYGNPITAPMLPSEERAAAAAGQDVTGAFAHSAATQGGGASQSTRVVNIVTDSNAAAAGAEAGADATKSDDIGVGMMRGSRRAIARRAAVQSAAIAAADAVDAAMPAAARASMLQGTAAVPVGVQALDAAVGASLGAAYTAVRHRRGGALVTVKDDSREIRGTRKALGGLALQSSRSAVLAAGQAVVKPAAHFTQETRSSLQRTSAAAASRKGPPQFKYAMATASSTGDVRGDRDRFRGTAAGAKALAGAEALARLAPPANLVQATQGHTGPPGGSPTRRWAPLLPQPDESKVTKADLMAAAASLAPVDEAPVPARLHSAIASLRHALAQPSADTSLVHRMAAASAARRAAAAAPVRRT